jgi:hypothetical protein
LGFSSQIFHWIQNSGPEVLVPGLDNLIELLDVADQRFDRFGMIVSLDEIFRHGRADHVLSHLLNQFLG